MKSYKFTILVRTYNSINVVSDSINSLENQIYKNFEVIFVDDGSSDGTLEFLKQKKFSFKHKLISQKHCGPFFGEIVGFLNCDRDSYFLLLDSDDLFFDYTLEKLNAILNENECDMLFFDYRVFKYATNGERIEKSSKKLSIDSYYSNVTSFVVDCFKNHYEAPLSAWNHAFKASLLSDLSFDQSFNKIVVGEELIAIFSYLLNVRTICYHRAELYLYRSNNPLSVTKHRRPFIDRYYFIFIGLKKVINDIEKSGLFSFEQVESIYSIIINDYFGDMLFDARVIGYKEFKRYAKSLLQDELFLKIFKKRKCASKYISKIILFIKIKWFYFSYFLISLRIFLKKHKIQL